MVLEGDAFGAALLHPDPVILAARFDALGTVAAASSAGVRAVRLQLTGFADARRTRRPRCAGLGRCRRLLLVDLRERVGRRLVLDGGGVQRVLDRATNRQAGAGGDRRGLECRGRGFQVSAGRVPSLLPLGELCDVTIEVASVLGEILPTLRLHVCRQLRDRLGRLGEPLVPGVGALRPGCASGLLCGGRLRPGRRRGSRGARPGRRLRSRRRLRLCSCSSCLAGGDLVAVADALFLGGVALEDLGQRHAGVDELGEGEVAAVAAVHRTAGQDGRARRGAAAETIAVRGSVRKGVGEEIEGRHRWCPLSAGRAR